MNRTMTLGWTVIFFLISLTAMADSVTMHSGKVIEGNITEKTDTYLKIETSQNKAGIYCLAENIDSVNGRKFRQYRMARNKLLTQKVRRQQGRRYPFVTITLKDGREFSGELILRNAQYFRILPSGEENYQEILTSEIASFQ